MKLERAEAEVEFGPTPTRAALWSVTRWSRAPPPSTPMLAPTWPARLQCPV